jgi:hypothetical protein
MQGVARGVFEGADAVGRDELFRAGEEVGGFDGVGFAGAVLFTAKMPVRHHQRHDEAPEDGATEPDFFVAGRAVEPGFGKRTEAHGRKAGSGEERGFGEEEFDPTPHGVGEIGIRTPRTSSSQGLSRTFCHGCLLGSLFMEV